MTGIESKSNSWKILNSWHIVLSLLFMVFFMGVLIPGLVVKKRKWIIIGIVLAAPIVFFMSVITNPANKDTFLANIGVVLFLISWATSIVYSIAIRKEYLFLLAEKGNDYSGYRNKYSKKKQEKKIVEQHDGLWQEVLQLKQMIITQIADNNAFDASIISDINPLVDKYVNQTKQLIARDKKLRKLVNKQSITEIDDLIIELKTKLTETTNRSLETEYQLTIDKYQKHRQVYREVSEQIEMNRLRLNSTVMSLKDIKLNLIKFEGIVSDEIRKNFIEDFHQKSNELTIYLDQLKDVYDDFG